MVTPVNSTTVTVFRSETQCFNGSGSHPLHCAVSVNVWWCCTTNETLQTVSGLIPNVAMHTFQVAAVGAYLKRGPFSSPVKPGEL